MRLNNSGTLSMTDLTITRAGSLKISNSAGAAGGPAAGGASALRMVTSCSVVRGNWSSTPAAAGTLAGTAGTKGANGEDLTYECDGDLTMSGGITIGTQAGGAGGGGSVSTSGTGGAGGNGGPLTIKAGGSMTLSGVTLVAGGGGAGGTITAKSLSLSATATGGDGGDGSIALIQAGGNVTIPAGGLTVTIGNGGAGGDAIADAGDGQSAGIDPAFDGGSATAKGGTGGNSANVVLLSLGIVTGRANIVASGGDGGAGGFADVRSGAGGDGNSEYSDGANGGALNGTGGTGGLARTTELTGSPIGRSGNGGKLKASRGRGGRGAGRCTPVPARGGGRGGRGGSLSGKPGLAGAGTLRGTNGVVELTEVGNGGNGDNGTPFGPGGAAGSFLVEPGFTRVDNGVSFTAGTPGTACFQTLTRNVVVRLSAIPNTFGEVPPGTHIVPIDDAITGQQIGTIPIITTGQDYNHYYGDNPSRIGTNQMGGFAFNVGAMVAPGLTDAKLTSATVTLVNGSGVTPQNPVKVEQTSSSGTPLKTTTLTSNNTTQTITLDDLIGYLTFVMGENPMVIDLLMAFGMTYSGPGAHQ
jgi:hypothetical protein